MTMFKISSRYKHMKIAKFQPHTSSYSLDETRRSLGKPLCPPPVRILYVLCVRNFETFLTPPLPPRAYVLNGWSPRVDCYGSIHCCHDWFGHVGQVYPIPGRIWHQTIGLVGSLCPYRRSYCTNMPAWWPHHYQVNINVYLY